MKFSISSNINCTWTLHGLHATTSSTVHLRASINIPIYTFLIYLGARSKAQVCWSWCIGNVYPCSHSHLNFLIHVGRTKSWRKRGWGENRRGNSCRGGDIRGNSSRGGQWSSGRQSARGENIHHWGVGHHQQKQGNHHVPKERGYSARWDISSYLYLRSILYVFLSEIHVTNHSGTQSLDSELCL